MSTFFFFQFFFQNLKYIFESMAHIKQFYIYGLQGLFEP